MQLKGVDSPLPARDTPTEAKPEREGLRISFLTKRPNLRLTIQEPAQERQATLSILPSVDLLQRAIQEQRCDVAIVDIECGNEWPDSIFKRVDEEAAEFPIIVLCNRTEDVSHYVWKAQHVVDVFPYEVVSDRRFFSVIQAAKLRSEYRTGLR